MSEIEKKLDAYRDASLQHPDYSQADEKAARAAIEAHVEELTRRGGLTVGFQETGTSGTNIPPTLRMPDKEIAVLQREVDELRSAIRAIDPIRCNDGGCACIFCGDDYHKPDCIWLRCQEKQ